MKAAEIRQKFLEFFESKGHTVVPSASLVPGNDPTLLFTNSGMVQFKDVFLGKEVKPYTRATSSQRSVRAGGKHNDLENVGYTARHHTFFEMLGNFSFGDYFKRDAIYYAWELLTTVYRLPKDKLWVTVYQDDSEAYDIWATDMGVPPERIVRIGDNKGARFASDNFWQMADTGPCGPCSEIFFDHGAEVWGGPPGSPEADGDRYIEIWNLVFMQFERAADGSMTPLPKPCVDTGMGLERIAAVLQHVHSNYEIDLFQTLIAATAREIAKQAAPVELANNSLKVIADHIRACSFLVVDGVIPGNEGRGYVLRRIIRRAIRHGYKLGCRTPFFYALVGDLVAEMGEAYPDLAKAATQVENVLKAEEERFFETIGRGMEILEKSLTDSYLVISNLERQLNPTQVGVETIVSTAGGSKHFDAVFKFDKVEKPLKIIKIHDLSDIKHILITAQRLIIDADIDSDSREYGCILAIITSAQIDKIELDKATSQLSESEQRKINIFHYNEDGLSKPSQLRVLHGQRAFLLHDTYGFPLDLTADICRERGFTVNTAEFDAAMAKQRDQARAAGKFKATDGLKYEGQNTQFVGFDTLAIEGATVLALYVDGAAVNTITAGQDAVVVLDKTSFYAESGGQVGDIGQLSSATACTFEVSDTHKIAQEVFGHHGLLAKGSLCVGDAVTATVDGERRMRTARNHSATHLMHKALREVLGEHVSQKGSLVDPEKTRFDFVHHSPLTDEQIERVETIVNRETLANTDTQARVLPLEEAKQTGAMMLFGEKYGDEVRVLNIGSSSELCGGTHVARTGDIGLFKITAESGVAAGVRRVEATTGLGALAYLQAQTHLLADISSSLKAPTAELTQKITQLLEGNKQLEKEAARLKSKLASSQGDALLAAVVQINGVNVLAEKMDNADIKTLREAADTIKGKLKSVALVLAAVEGDKISLIAAVTSDLTGKIKAGELVNMVALQVGGKGGGRPDMAQAGGTEPALLTQALSSVAAWAKGKL